MFCTNCKQARVENETPCPHCGAPSSLLQVSGIGQWGTSNSENTWTAGRAGTNNSLLNSNVWGGPVSYGTAGVETNQPAQQQSPLVGSQPQWEAPISQLGFDQPAPSSPNANWSQMSPVTANAGQENGAPSQALVPAIYQPQANNFGQGTVALQLIPDHAVEHLLPEIAGAPDGVYVPPLYTKPRPLTPRYRVISGALSVLIVVLALCGGAGYYAKASGTLDRISRMFTGGPPPPQAQTAVVTTKLPPPPDKIDYGPAKGIIPSGTTTLHIDKQFIALETDKVFTVKQTFYVTYTVQPPQGQDGKVTVKWYMDGQFYDTTTEKNVIKGGTVINESVTMQYSRPAQGSVEIYWNNDLAERFYFVVQPQ